MRNILVSQGADTDGEVETQLYKANVVPTCGGGAQVVFNDVDKHNEIPSHQHAETVRALTNQRK